MPLPHTNEKTSSSSVAAHSLLPKPGASSERSLSKGESRQEVGQAGAPMQNSKLYSLLFIYLTILKYLRLCFDQKQ